MKKSSLLFIISVLTVLFSMTTVLPVNADTLSSSQVVALVTGPSCVAINANLVLGSTDASTRNAVSALQSFLHAQGYFSIEATGYFGTQTLRAVQQFQLSRSISPVGSVGPVTRAAIQASCVAQPIVPATSTHALAPTQKNTSQQASVIQALAPVVPNPTLGTKLPYQPSSFTGWESTWGSVATTSAGTLIVKATPQTTGAEAVFLGSKDWVDYRYTADMSIGNGDVTLIGRYVDDSDFVACTFTGNWIAVQERLHGDTQTVASASVDSMSSAPLFQKSTSFSIRVQGTTVGCSAFGSADNVTYIAVDPSLMKGGIGIATWHPDHGVAHLELRGVRVEAE